MRGSCYLYVRSSKFDWWTCGDQVQSSCVLALFLLAADVCSPVMDFLKAFYIQQFSLEARWHNCRQIASLLLWCCGALHSSIANQWQRGRTPRNLKKINTSFFGYSCTQFYSPVFSLQIRFCKLVMWLGLVLSLLISHAISGSNDEKHVMFAWCFTRPPDVFFLYILIS